MSSSAKKDHPICFGLIDRKHDYWCSTKCAYTKRCVSRTLALNQWEGGYSGAV